MVVSQTGIILAVGRVSELHIDCVYQRFDAKKRVASSGVTPATGPAGALKGLVFHRALTFAVTKGFSGPLLDANASQSLASAA